MKNHQLALPHALESSDDYMALNPEQQAAFIGRLQSCAELALEIVAPQSKSTAELFETIDDLELDALSIMSTTSDPAKTVSPYRVHSSWLFECDKKDMSSKVDSSTAKFLRLPAFVVDSNREYLAQWLNDWADEMRKTFSRLERATSFSHAVAQLVVVDALIATLLVFTAASRLNANNP